MEYIMKNITKLALISSVTSIIFIGCGDSGVRTTQRRDDSNSSLSFTTALKTTHSDILKAINRARAVARDCHDGRGVVGPSVALSWNSELYASAYEHSSDLANSDTFSHIGSGTSSDITGSNLGHASKFNERIEANGYVDFKIIGENIAGGIDNIKSVLEAWLNSPEHCKNIMESDYREMGVAVIVNPDSKYGIYWTESFGG